MSQIISKEDYQSRFAVWCGRDKEFSSLPSKRKDRWILFHAFMRTLSGDGPWTEKQINEAIRDWLAGPGRCLHVDHVWIRRELIDGGFLARDAAGTEYQRADRFRRQFDFAPAVEAIDLDALIEQERQRVLDRRDGPTA